MGGKRKDHWLSYKEEDKRVGLWTEKSAAAQWKLIACSVNGMNGFKLKCSFKGVDKGWLSYKNDGKWNHLYEKESDAAVYVMESLSVPQVGRFYAMHSFYDGVDQKYLSYWAERGWCRQIYDNASDAKWEFVQSDELNKYLIVNRYPDKHKNTYLSYFNDGLRMSLWTKKSDAAKWELIPCPVGNGLNGFKLRCWYGNDCKGWLSYRNDGKWNHLYAKESDAAVYVLESL